MGTGSYKDQAKALADELLLGLGWHYPENHPDRDRAERVLAEYEYFDRHCPDVPMVEQARADEVVAIARELLKALEAIVQQDRENFELGYQALGPLVVQTARNTIAKAKEVMP
jgi:hypothetical protein